MVTVPDLSGKSLDVSSNYPNPEYWNTDIADKRQARKDELEQTLPNADIIGIVDSDSDGLACEVVLREAYEDQNTVVIQARGGEYGFDTVDIMLFVAEHSPRDADVIVADLAPNSQFSSYMAALSEIDGQVSIYDHHDWPWFVYDSIDTVVDNIVVDDEQCAAQIVQQERYPDATVQLTEFLDVTADHDLWLKEDERSDHLSTLSFRLDRGKYVDAARAHGGNMVEENPMLRQRYEESEQKAENRADIAVETAEWHEFDDHSVAITYLNCHQSRVGNSLIESGADIAVIIQPTLSVSFRSAEETPISADLARELGGGGHPTAAGAHLGNHIDASYTQVWETGGQEPVSFVADFLATTL